MSFDTKHIRAIHCSPPEVQADYRLREACDEVDSLRSRLKEVEGELARTKEELSRQERRANENGQERDRATEAWQKAESLLAKCGEALRAAAQSSAKQDALKDKVVEAAIEVRDGCFMDPLKNGALNEALSALEGEGK